MIHPPSHLRVLQGQYILQLHRHITLSSLVPRQRPQLISQQPSPSPGQSLRDGLQPDVGMNLGWCAFIDPNVCNGLDGIIRAGSLPFVFPGQP